MTDEFTNRFGSFETALGVLNSDDYKPVWFSVPPVKFTEKVAGAQTAVANLDAFCKEQGLGVHGVAWDKDDEESKL